MNLDNKTIGKQILCWGYVHHAGRHLTAVESQKREKMPYSANIEIYPHI